MRTFIFFICVLSALALEEGENCTDKGQAGVCTNILKCSGAIDDLRKSPPIRRKTCGFHNDTPIICCPSKSGGQSGPMRPEPMGSLTTPRKPSTTTTTPEYTPEVEDYIELVAEDTNTCKPLKIQAKSTDRKAWKKCLQYQEELIYPCETSKALLGGKVRGMHCKHTGTKLIVGGVDAGEAEFPHMVMLSHDSDPEKLEFSCGGSLLSDLFILTAAHCTYKPYKGQVKYAVLGVLKLSLIDKNKVYKIDKVIKHPNYKSPIHYDDIALLKTDKMMHLNMFAVPACLDVGSESDDSRALATGWGALWNRGENSDTLQKVIVNKFDELECRKHYTENDRTLPHGYNSSIQMCYGDKESAKDTCTGDSGGPLQVKMQDIECMYAIIGVTSFGGRCGKVGVPAIYTRVSNYVPWIEENVWPDD